MPIVRKKLIPAEVYPEDIRYNPDTDQIESNVNGDWIPNPDADPRKQTTFPPHITADTACDAAQSVVDAFKVKIADILTAIDSAATVFAIASLILSIFTFGAYAVFVGLAIGVGEQMLTAGTGALEAALSDPVYEQLRCILYCRMNAQGRVKAGQFGGIISDVNDQIGGLGAAILTGMLNLAGEGGVNNLASLGTSDGDCSTCDCACTTPTIPANAFSTNTGRIIAIGDHVVINATGSWCYGPPPDFCTDADGIPWASDPDFQVPAGGLGTLVGKIGTGAWFVVGSHMDFTSVDEGTFLMGFNDDFFGDNAGELSVEICVNVT